MAITAIVNNAGQSVRVGIEPGTRIDVKAGDTIEVLGVSGSEVSYVIEGGDLQVILPGNWGNFTLAQFQALLERGEDVSLRWSGDGETVASMEDVLAQIDTPVVNVTLTTPLPSLTGAGGTTEPPPESTLKTTLSPETVLS